MLNSVSGVLFTEDQRESPTELAFKYAVYRINKDHSILPNTTLVYDIQYVPREDSFHASKKGKVFFYLLNSPCRKSIFQILANY